MERNPHQLIEGIIISAYAIEADTAYIFLRWEYGRCGANLTAALGEAYGAGYLGRAIAGSRFDLDVRLHTSAGRYICGEETALLNALEGKRAIPRTKPPFPQVCGLGENRRSSTTRRPSRMSPTSSGTGPTGISASA